MTGFFVWAHRGASALAPENTLAAFRAAERAGADGIELDVRTPGEFMQLRLDGAHLIPIDQLLRRIGELPKDRPILVYCAVGSRSSQVAGYLAQQGYSEVYNLYGGISAWQLRGYPVLQGAP